MLCGLKCWVDFCNDQTVRLASNNERGVMDFQIGFNIAVGIAGIFVGWFLNSLRDNMKSLTDADILLTEKVQKIEVLVVGQYVTRADYHNFTTALFAKLDRIENKLDVKAGQIEARLDGKADKQ